jgi:hypothetical protein
MSWRQGRRDPCRRTRTWARDIGAITRDWRWPGQNLHLRFAGFGAAAATGHPPSALGMSANVVTERFAPRWERSGE